MKKRSEETLYRLRRLRKARRLWKSAPLLAYAMMADDFPGYSYDQFIGDLKRRTKPKVKAKKTTLCRFGRFSRMQQLLQDYLRSKKLEPLIQANVLRSRITKPYRMAINIKGQVLEYQFSPLISISDIESLNSKVRHCKTAAEVEQLVQQFYSCSCHFTR